MTSNDPIHTDAIARGAGLLARVIGTRWAPFDRTRKVGIVRQYIAAFLIAASFSGCAPTPDRSLDSSDLIFGKFPATETFLRLKAPCYFVPPNSFGFYLPPGDYTPISADAQGIFYGTPGGSLPYEYIRPGKAMPTYSDGIHFPFEVRASFPPSLWARATSLEWGTQRRVRSVVLPDQCWKPYGTTMVIIHIRSGVEIPLR